MQQINEHAWILDPPSIPWELEHAVDLWSLPRPHEHFDINDLIWPWPLDNPTYAAEIHAEPSYSQELDEANTLPGLENETITEKCAYLHWLKDKTTSLCDGNATYGRRLFNWVVAINAGHVNDAMMHMDAFGTDTTLWQLVFNGNGTERSSADGTQGQGVLHTGHYAEAMNYWRLAELHRRRAKGRPRRDYGVILNDENIDIDDAGSELPDMAAGASGPICIRPAAAIGDTSEIITYINKVAPNTMRPTWPERTEETTRP